MPDDPSVQAVMYGPLVLAGRFDAVAKDLLYSEPGPKVGAQTKVPDIVAHPGHPAVWIEPDPTHHFYSTRSVNRNRSPSFLFIR